MEPKELALIAVSVAAGVFLIALIVLTLKLRGVKKRAESDEKRADQGKGSCRACGTARTT